MPKRVKKAIQQQKSARTEFSAAIAQIVADRNVSAEAVIKAIQVALTAAFRRQFGPLSDEFYYTAIVSPETGESRIVKYPVLTSHPDTAQPLTWDESKEEDVTPAGFGRIAAQTAKQVILQSIRESEREQIFSEFSQKIGEMVTGQVLRMEGRTVLIDLGKGHGYMPPEEQMRGEFYRMNSRVAVFLKEIRETPKGRSIIVSRAATELVVKLFEREVPEVASGAVKIVSIAREAGVRTKLSVASDQENVDPVGSCVGQRGVRVQQVINELNNEKIDIIPFSTNKHEYLKAALAPADHLKIEIDEAARFVRVTAPDDQLSLAIGRGGQNVRLAAKLTGYQITIQSAAGQVHSAVTGEEEYELDTFKWMTPELRELLIQNKLTTVMDWARFTDRWSTMEAIPEDVKKEMHTLVEAFQKEMAEREKNRPTL